MRLFLRLLLPLALFMTTVGLACGSLLTPETTNVPLTPARQLEGTWKSTTPVRLTYATDYCGVYQNVSTSMWDATVTLTAVSGYTNVLNAEVRLTMSPQTRVSTTQCSGTANGWAIAPSPLMLQMTVSSSAFTAKREQDGITLWGTYTSTQMMATWYRKECILYCWGEASVENELKLFKQ